MDCGEGGMGKVTGGHRWDQQTSEEPGQSCFFSMLPYFPD